MNGQKKGKVPAFASVFSLCTLCFPLFLLQGVDICFVVDGRPTIQSSFLTRLLVCISIRTKSSGSHPGHSSLIKSLLRAAQPAAGNKRHPSTLYYAAQSTSTNAGLSYGTSETTRQNWKIFSQIRKPSSQRYTTSRQQSGSKCKQTTRFKR